MEASHLDGIRRHLKIVKASCAEFHSFVDWSRAAVTQPEQPLLQSKEIAIGLQAALNSRV